ncbi:hypothetical protein HS088_TW03G00067 [Tripterygium wilfordii]|uniref:J domain-containing protein n=1 Tax=Tripterygium wilfordii TaxID=458696 RepID=A0A7J7DTP3_TRIWF|nr:uncharacterized protein LOC119995242 [Tripterygium wilfordii]KAF5749742.1 hypothetical protein HS088_TW03G00067 [Tripterygium wilfordii]
MEQGTSRDGSEPATERFLRQAFQHLRLRDFSSARKYALLLQDSDATRPEPAHILSVADVMLAAERRLPNGSLDWYSILQLDQVRPDSHTQIAMQAQFGKLLSLLNPKENQFPFSQLALNHVCDAWSVLSNRAKKAQYDSEIENYIHKPQNSSQPGRECESSFWTVCPYCYHMYEYEKKYEECCLRCEQCRRAFHGVAVPPPPDSVLEEGNEGYYCGFGIFPLAYKNGDFSEKIENNVGGGDDGSLGDKKEDSCGGLKRSLDNLVEISDDSDDNGGNEENEKGDIYVNLTAKGLEEEAVKEMGEKVEENVGLGEMGCNVEESEESVLRNEGKRPMKRVKSVARNSKKMMGKGKKMHMNVGFGEAVEENNH